MVQVGVMALAVCVLLPPLRAAERFKPFRLKSPEGAEVQLADVQGRATLVVFFFPTCGYCRAFLPEATRVYDTYKDRGLSMVWINVVPKEDRLVAEWREAHGVTVPVLLGGRSTPRDYAVAMTPTHYLLDANGLIVSRHAGYARGDEAPLERRIQDLLAAP